VSFSNLSKQKTHLRVLHVDDDFLFLEVSKQILELENAFVVDSAYTVDDALEKLLTRNYDAIVCDYELPQKNGLHLLEELRKRGSRIPFIMFTGTGRDVIGEALALGANCCLSKHGAIESVFACLAYAISNACTH